MNPTPRIEATSLAIRIGARIVCNDFSFAIHAGQCWAVLGCNGSGKTTLLHTLAGLRSPQTGIVRVNGDPINSLSARARARRIGVLLQDYDDAHTSTVLDTAMMGRYPHLRAWEFETASDIANAHDILRTLEIDALEPRLLTTLSGGERRRARIATILLQAPGLYLLDEPTNHLDVHHQIHVLDLLHHRLRDDSAAALMAIHDVNLAARVCDHAILLMGGGRVTAGRFDEVVTAENLSSLYGHDMRLIKTNSTHIFVPN